MSKKIAMLCMALDIGGAETHIFELSKQLKRQGNDVTVFSNGGVYVERLEAAGIRHVKAPLHTNNLPDLIRSYRIILKEFKKRRPSVVHSHTRISNYVGGLVCKRMRIPMVTTVHGQFYNDVFSKLVSNWGTRALAVSEDLKDYLITNYHYDPDKVILTVNGIDTERFANCNAKEARSALGIGPNQKTVLFVSRLDRDSSEHIFRFLRIAPKLFEQNKDTRVLIVGDGEDFKEISARVEKINQHCGCDFIRMEGARTDIEQYTAVADLFIGISRAALEAMSAGVPTILMGNPGYLGLYSDRIKKKCIETNLTCRKSPYPSDEEILQVIINCLEANDLSKEIADGKQLVQAHYSLSKMADTALQQYYAAIEDHRPNDYMISGYYGCENFGDDLTLACLMRHLSGKKGAVLTCDPKRTPLPEHVRKIHRFSMREIDQLMKRSKVVLLGSGSILQDATSYRSFFYYYVILRMAIHNRCKTMLYANGIGPIIRRSNLLRLKKLLKHIDCITLRDEKSINYLKELGCCERVYLTADDSFSRPPESIEPIKPDAAVMGRKIVGINLKIHPQTPDQQLTEIADALFYLAQKHDLYYYFIPFHYEQDLAMLSRLSSMLPNASTLIRDAREPEQLIRYIASADYQIFERLHGQILSTILGIPYLPVNYDLKISSFARQVGLEDYLLDHKHLNKETLIHSFERVIEEQEQICEKLLRYTESAQLRVQQNKDKLIQLIEEY